MSEALKDWLPITVRNRVALGFAFVALVMFVVWNFLPFYEYNNGSSHARYIRGGSMFMNLWSEYISPDYYINIFFAPDRYKSIKLAIVISYLINSLLLLIIIPFWKIIHASKYLTLPFALSNFVQGCLYFIGFAEIQDGPPYLAMRFLLTSISMLAMSISLFIFKNELGLRHEREVRKMM